MKFMNSANDSFKRHLVLGAALALAASGVVAGCSDDETTSSTTTSTTSTTSAGGTGTSSAGGAGGEDITVSVSVSASASGTGGAGGSSTSATSATSATSSTSSGAGGAGGDKPVKPADCVDLSLTGIDLVSQQQNAFDNSDSTPVIRTRSSLANLAGDATKFDRLRILFDGDAGIGVHALDPNPAHALPDYSTTFVSICSACVVYQEDLDTATNAYQKTFAAKAGDLDITALLTPHQSAGSAHNVELREIAKDPATGTYGWKAGGACYWIEEATYDVRRPKGCKPFVAGSCPSNQYCMPTNSVGSDGECVTGGAKTDGQSCTLQSATAWDSDCALGLRCIDPGSGAICIKVCDLLSAAPGCPAGTHCGGGYNVCADEEEFQNSGIDEAVLGAPCATNPTALYCGGSGQPGTCWDDDGDAGPMPATCVPFSSAPSQCVAPKTPGYIAYKNGIDNSTLWCITPP